MRIGAISKPSCARQSHEEMTAAKCSLAETTAELGVCCPTPSFYEIPAGWPAAHAGRDLFPVGRLVRYDETLKAAEESSEQAPRRLN